VPVFKPFRERNNHKRKYKQLGQMVGVGLKYTQ